MYTLVFSSLDVRRNRCVIQNLNCCNYLCARAFQFGDLGLTQPYASTFSVSCCSERLLLRGSRRFKASTTSPELSFFKVTPYLCKASLHRWHFLKTYEIVFRTVSCVPAVWNIHLYHVCYWDGRVINRSNIFYLKNGVMWGRFLIILETSFS